MEQRLASSGLRYERFKAYEPENGTGELIVTGNLDDRAKACYRSHYELLKKISKGKDRNILILEDDAIFSVDFKEKLDILLTEMPEDFDLCYLGASDDNVQWKLRLEGFEVLCMADHQWCLHGVIVNKKAVSKILETAKNMYAAIDQVYVDLQLSLKTFASHPYIIHQDGSKSDLR